MTIAGSLLRSFISSAVGNFTYAFKPYTQSNVGKNYLKDGRVTWAYHEMKQERERARNLRNVHPNTAPVRVTPRRPGDFTSPCWSRGERRLAR